MPPADAPLPAARVTETPAEPVGPIRVRGARTHNLQGVDLDLPRNQWIAFCGVSGSGKTSMAIDTLYAEGQRRYIESFSTYTRQFLERVDKPPVDRIDGLPPAVAITQDAGSPGAAGNRTTVATATEVADHLRVLLARVGAIVCPGCGEPVRRDTVGSIAQWLGEARSGARLLLAFESPVGRGGAAGDTNPSANGPAAAAADDWVADQTAAGYVRTIIEETTYEIGPGLAPQLVRAASARVVPLVVVDRLSADAAAASRTAESIEAAMTAGGEACVAFAETEPAAADVTLDGRPCRRRRFSRRLRCEPCRRDFLPPTPQLLNHNHSLGACPRCEGFGSVPIIDMNRVIPDASKTIRGGAVAPWNTPAYSNELRRLLDVAAEIDLPVDLPLAELSEHQRRRLVHGAPEHGFGGVDGFFRWLERKKYKTHVRAFLSRWRSYRRCPDCGGARLRPEALAVRLGGKNLADICGMRAGEAEAILLGVSLPPGPRAISRPLVRQVVRRLGYLQRVGLGYLTLDRPVRTLSGGEARRVAMTTTLGSSLVDMLYVLDEPSAGLHPVDVPALAGAIAEVRDRGNTVVVVEHTEELVRAADHVVEFGPGAGAEGGRIVFRGAPAALAAAGGRTGDWLAGRRTLAPATRRSPGAGWLSICDASGNNLRGVDARFPLGVLCVVTGVSGAGKSSLVTQTLLPALTRRLSGDDAGGRREASRTGGGIAPLPHRSLEGAHHLEHVLPIDRSPLGRSSRSNPVTYVKALDPIRAVFAEQPEAKSCGFTTSHFSFNVEGGRCESCQGAGRHDIDMQFMADVSMLCPECGGSRFRDEVLQVKYRGCSIAEVLAMPAQQALRFFRGEGRTQSRLKVLLDVGLGYVPLGQPTSTLSGGEAQRLKLAGRLAAKQSGPTLFVLEEPTAGLHNSDVTQLIDCLGALIDVGHSVVAIDHKPQMMLAADWLIDLGPGAGDRGGTIVATGPPEEVAREGQSPTGSILAAALARDARLLASLDDDQ